MAVVAAVPPTLLPVRFRTLLDYPTDEALERALRQPQLQHPRQPILAGLLPGLPKKDEGCDDVQRLEPSKKRRRGDDEEASAPTAPAPWLASMQAPMASSPPSLLASNAEDGEEGPLQPNTHHPHHHECSWDWRIDTNAALKDAPDSNLSEPQTLEKELDRLRVLRSYAHLLAGENGGGIDSSTIEQGLEHAGVEEPLKRMTALAARWLSTPLCVVSLIDLGRAVVVTSHGPFPSDKVVQARHHSLCSYAILSPTGFLVIPDCSKDERFQHLNVVTMEGGVRFYAGAVLCSPEGHRLGAIAVASPVPRPDGLSSEERNSLQELADLVSHALKMHRQLHDQRHQLSSQRQKLASASHALATPLSALQLSLHLLSGDPDVRRKLKPSHHDLLTTATQCAVALGDACESLRTTDRIDGDGTPLPGTSVAQQDKNSQDEDEAAAKADVEVEWKVSRDTPHSLSLTIPVPLTSVAPLRPPPPSPPSSSSQGTTVPDFADKLRRAAEGLAASVPVAIAFDSSEHDSLREVEHRAAIPEPLRFFRAVLDLLIHSCERTNTGSVALILSVEFCAAGDDRSPAVRVECRDNGPRLPEDNNGAEAKSAPRLRFVVESVCQLGGTFGIRSLDGPAHTTCCWCTVPLTTSPDEFPPAKPLEAWPSPPSKRSISELSLSSVSGADPGHWSRRDATPALPPHLVNADAEQFLSSIVAPVPRPLLQGSGPLHKPRRALVIDDSLVVRKVLANALARIGFHADQAVDGMDGLRQLQSKRFDLVLCDFLMPVMDGLDCVREYRRWEVIHRPHFRQFIVGMSAHATGRDVEQSLNLGMNDYRPKPLTLDVLQSLERSRQGMERCESTDTVASVRNRRCPSPTSRRLLDSHHGQSKACLVATSDPVGRSLIDQAATQYGWTCISADSGDETLDLLKRRNWGAALLDNDLVAMHCIQEFRVWEKRNRVHRQSNIFLMSSDLNTIADARSHEARAYVQAPDGVDGAINKPPRKEDLEGLFIMRKSDNLPHAFKASDIITR